MKAFRNSRPIYFGVAAFLSLGLAAVLGYQKLLEAGLIFPTNSNAANADSSTLYPVPTAINDLLGLPEAQIDIGTAALTLAKERYPNIEVARYSAKLDNLAEQVRRLTKGNRDPDQRIRCLNTVLLRHENFKGVRDTSSARNSENYFLNNVLDTKRGNCFTMPVLYVAVAQRLGWPVYPVNVPDHSFVRYVDPNLREQNIETTSNGGTVPDEIYARDFAVSDAGRKNGTYLATLTYRESLGDLVAVNGIWFGQRGDLLRAVSYLELALQLNPRLAGAWLNLAIAYRKLAIGADGAKREKSLARAAECSKTLGELGFVHPKDVPQFNSTGRPIR